MSDRLLERMGAACGIVYLVLVFVGGLSGLTSIARFFLVFPGFLFFLFFLGSLWSGMRRAEEGSGWLSTTAFGAGFMSVTINLGGAAALVAARHRTGELDPQLARLLRDIEEASFILTLLPLAVLLAAFAIVAIRSDGLPGWLGGIAAVISAAFLIGGLAESADLGGDWLLIPMLVGAFPFWIIATSVVLMRSAGESRPVERGSPTGGATPARQKPPETTAKAHR